MHASADPNPRWRCPRCKRDTGVTPAEAIAAGVRLAPEVRRDHVVCVVCRFAWRAVAKLAAAVSP